MPSTTRLFLTLGSASAMLAVLFGAFGAHALRARLSPDLMEVYHTATQYHFYHSLGLLIVALIAARFPELATVRWAGWLMVLGILLFSGSLYILSVSGMRWLGVITPFGGLAFIAAWGLLAVAAFRAA